MAENQTTEPPINATYINNTRYFFQWNFNDTTLLISLHFCFWGFKKRKTWNRNNLENNNCETSNLNLLVPV